MLLQDLVVILQQAPIRNLSETPFARVGASIYEKPNPNLAILTKRKPKLEAILTKFDNLSNAYYRGPAIHFASIEIARIVRQNKDGTRTWWRGDGTSMIGTIRMQNMALKMSPGTTLALVSAENFMQQQADINDFSPWHWHIGNSATPIAHQGPNQYWVKVPANAKDGFTIPIWLEYSSAPGQKALFFGYIDGVAASPNKS